MTLACAYKEIPARALLVNFHKDDNWTRGKASVRCFQEQLQFAESELKLLLKASGTNLPSGSQKKAALRKEGTTALYFQAPREYKAPACHEHAGRHWLLIFHRTFLNIEIVEGRPPSPLRTSIDSDLPT